VLSKNQKKRLLPNYQSSIVVALFPVVPQAGRPSAIGEYQLVDPRWVALCPSPTLRCETCPDLWNRLAPYVLGLINLGRHGFEGAGNIDPDISSVQ